MVPMNGQASCAREDGFLPFPVLWLTGIQIVCVTNTGLVFPAVVPFSNMFALQPAINQFLPTLKNLLF